MQYILNGHPLIISENFVNGSSRKKQLTVLEEKTLFPCIRMKHIKTSTTIIYPALKEYVLSLEDSVNLIPEVRREKLECIARHIIKKLQEGRKAELVFICTHNSRRSHFGQVWAALAAKWYSLDKVVQTYSGGTEVTEFNPRAVDALQRAGFRSIKSRGSNPRYELLFSNEDDTLTCYSKRFDDSSNPQQNFVAIMTCSDADENCPVIAGASFREVLSYLDPKVSDGTDQEKTTYDKRCQEIAREVFYMISLIKEQPLYS